MSVTIVSIIGAINVIITVIITAIIIVNIVVIILSLTLLTSPWQRSAGCAVLQTSGINSDYNELAAWSSPPSTLLQGSGAVGGEALGIPRHHPHFRFNSWRWWLRWWRRWWWRWWQWWRSQSRFSRYPIFVSDMGAPFPMWIRCLRGDPQMCRIVFKVISIYSPTHFPMRQFFWIISFIGDTILFLLMGVPHIHPWQRVSYPRRISCLG